MQWLGRLNDYLGRRPKLVIGLLVVGIVARFALVWRGHNFDMDSWRLAAGITAHHGNVYAETYRYNYGPVWFELLHVFDRIAQWLPNPYHAFRFFIVTALTAADLGIWWLLRKHFGLAAALLFFLNPISIIITGYHNQFDTLAIVVALAAASLYATGGTSLSRRKLWALALLGLSLTIKHVFFLFPLWLAVRERDWRQKLVVLSLPVVIFLLSFVPFLVGGEHGIVKNVFGYASFNNAPFWYLFVPTGVQAFVGFKALFFGAMVAGAFALRRRPVVESLLLYSIVLVVFSPAIANQYLAIVCAAIAVYPNIFFAFYVAASTLLLALSPAGLHSDKLGHFLPGFLREALIATYRAYDIPIALLAIGLFWVFWKRRIIVATRRLTVWLRKEVRFQMDSLSG